MNEKQLELEKKLGLLEEQIAQAKLSIRLDEITSDDIASNDRYKMIFYIGSMIYPNTTKRELIMGYGQNGFYLKEDDNIDLIIEFFTTVKELRDTYNLSKQ